MLRLILPIIFPSWRFFNSIGPSPRVLIQFDDGPWQEYQPKPTHLNVRERLRHLLCNSRGNAMLFVQSCATRLFDEIELSAVENIFLALTQALKEGQLHAPHENSSLSWRVEQLDWTHLGKITANVTYTSETRSVATLLRQWRADSKLWR